jgi:hypothetical protein
VGANGGALQEGLDLAAGRIHPLFEFLELHCLPPALIRRGAKRGAMLKWSQPIIRYIA